MVRWTGCSLLVAMTVTHAMGGSPDTPPQRTITLAANSWTQLQGAPIDWPQPGQPLILSPGQSLASKQPLRIGECCIVRVRLKTQVSTRPHAWDAAPTDPRWGLRNLAGTEILAFRVVGQQGFLDCLDQNNLPRPLPRPLETETTQALRVLPHSAGGPRVHFIDQHADFTYASPLDYQFAMTAKDVLAHVTAAPRPPGGWLAERLVNPRGPMSVWLHSGDGRLVIESVRVVAATSLKLDKTILNARKFQQKYHDVEQLLKQLRADFNLDAHDAYRTRVESTPEQISVIRQISKLVFDRQTCRITAATIDGVSPRGLSLPNLVVLDENHQRFEQAAARDGKLLTTTDKFHVFVEGEFTPRNQATAPFPTSFLVRYTLHKMNGLVTLEVRPRHPVAVRRLTLEHELGQTQRGLRFYYLEGEPGPNPASLTWQYAWDTGTLNETTDGPLSLYRSADQPINNGHFLTIHDGQLGFQFLPVTWNYSQLDPDPLWELSSGGWSLPGESLRSKNWQSQSVVADGQKYLVLRAAQPQATAQRRVMLPEHHSAAGKASTYDVWIRIQGHVELSFNQRRVVLDQRNEWAWRRAGTCPAGPLQVEVRSQSKNATVDHLYFLPVGSPPPQNAVPLRLRDRNFHKVTLSRRNSAPVVHVTFVNQPQPVNLDPGAVHTYAFGCLPPKHWQPRHDNTTSLETMFQAQHLSDKSKNWERSWRQDLPEMARAINALTKQSGLTLAAVNQGGYFGVGWPITEPRILNKLIASVRSNKARMLAYNDVSVGQSGTLIEWGYYLTQELRDEAPTAIPNWLSLESRTWRAHNLLRTREILDRGFDAIYFDSTNVHATLFNRFGWNNTLGLQRFYEDAQLLLRHLGKQGGLVAHCWGQIPLVNVGLADMTLPGEQYWVGKHRRGYLEPAALQSSFNSYLAGCQVVGLLGSDAVPFTDPQFYHQMLGNGWYSWFQYYPLGISTKEMKVPAFNVKQLALFRRFHDPLVIFGTEQSTAIDFRQATFTDWADGLPQDIQATIYHRSERTMVVLTRADITAPAPPPTRIRLNIDKLQLGIHPIVLDAMTRQSTPHQIQGAWLELPDLDLTFPRQILFLRQPPEPRLIWHDLQCRKIIRQTYDPTSNALQVTLEGVPGARSKLVAWYVNRPVYFQIQFGKQSRQSVKLRLPRRR